MNEEAIAGLDIGSTKTCAVVAVPRYGELEIIGFGEAPSDGLQRGVVTNLEAVVSSIEAATEAAERMAGMPVSRIYLGVSGDHVRTSSARGSVAISNDQHEVGNNDIVRVLRAMGKSDLGDDRRLLHTFPKTFTVDGTQGVVNPLGMEAKRLEVDAHIVTGGSQTITNLLKCVTRAGLESVGLVFEPVASSAATLDAEAMQAGVLLLDIGGGTTDIAIFSGGRAVYTSVVPVGGMLLTRDLAAGLRTTHAEAERLKRLYDFDAPDERIIDVTMLAGQRDRRIEHMRLREIIAPRMTEMMHLVRTDLAKVGERDLHVEEIVLTGGGSNLLGIEGFASSLFGLPARVAVPSMVEGLTEEMKQPQYATAVGLLVFGPKSTARAAQPRRRSPIRRFTTWFSDLWN